MLIRDPGGWVRTGGLLALLGLVAVVWPERGLVPHPLPFPPSAASRPVAAWSVLSYPLLAIGVVAMVLGAGQIAVDKLLSLSRR